MFYGRNSEIDKLNELYSTDKFEFAIIYGRRRVGKTTIIREFIKNKNAIFFTANESTSDDNLVSLSRCIGGRNDAPVYQDYESAVSAVFDMARDERLVFVIDEYPYLAESFKGISSLLQIAIDHRKDSSKIMIVLCGSSMSFMENQVLGYKSPLYGRRTAQFKILPFTFFESVHFFNGFSDIDKAILYGTTGGIPEYLNKIDQNKSVRKNIIDLFLSPSGHFFEEPSNLIKQELREPSTYNVIVESIASGASRLNEIATKAKLESNKCAKYLSSLISLGLVSKEYPYGETVSKRSIYRLDDNMFRFWYRFVFSNMSAITVGMGDAVYDNEVEPQLNAYMGLIFEDICKQWLFEQARKNMLPFFVGSFGRWWGTNPKTRQQVEIDIMAAKNNNAIFAECKWKNADVSINVLDSLKQKSTLFEYLKPHWYIFVKNDCTSELRNESSCDSVNIITLSQMMELT